MPKTKAQQERERLSPKHPKSVSSSDAEGKSRRELTDEELGRASGGVQPGPCHS
jgi:hypothetical protein